MMDPWEMIDFSDYDEWEIQPLPVTEAEVFANVGGNQPPQFESLPPLTELYANNVGDNQPPLAELFANDVGGNQPPQFQSLSPLTEAEIFPNDVSDNQPPLPPLTKAEQFADNVGANQPPQFQWPSQFQCPLHQAVWTGDGNNTFGANVGGNQQPQPQSLPQLAANVCGYHRLQPQARPQLAAHVCGYHRPQPQALPQALPVWTANGNNIFGANVGGNQQPQPQPQSLPQLAANVCGYHRPLPQARPQLAAHVCGYHRPQPQALPQAQPVWTGDDNEQFEMVMAEYLPKAVQNRLEDLVALLPGKTPRQIQEHFQKLMKDINLIHKSYITFPPRNVHHTSIAAAAPQNMTIKMAAPVATFERNPLSIPIINGTPPPPPPYWTDHQHHRMEVVAATAIKAAPMGIMLSSSAMEAATRGQNQPANKRLLEGKEGKQFIGLNKRRRILPE